MSILVVGNSRSSENVKVMVAERIDEENQKKPQLVQQFRSVRGSAGARDHTAG